MPGSARLAVLHPWPVITVCDEDSEKLFLPSLLVGFAPLVLSLTLPVRWLIGSEATAQRQLSLISGMPGLGSRQTEQQRHAGLTALRAGRDHERGRYSLRALLRGRAVRSVTLLPMAGRLVHMRGACGRGLVSDSVRFEDEEDEAEERGAVHEMWR